MYRSKDNKRPRQLPISTRGTQQIDYPWEFMRVGDYCDIPLTMATQSSVSATARTYARKHRGYQFSTTTLTNAQGVKVVRLTRVSKLQGVA